MALTNGVHVNGDPRESKTAEEDATASPYTTRPITVKIGINGTPFQILEGFVLRYPGLQARMKQHKVGAPIELPEVDEDVGHTLSHFIYTGHYNGVGVGGVSEAALATAEFKQSVLAYCAARLCIIDALEQITKDKMDHFSQQLSIFELHDIVVGVASKLPENEVWFPEHLYRWIKRILKDNDDITTSERLLALVDDCLLFNKALVKSITELYAESRATVQMLSSNQATAHVTVLETNPADDQLKNLTTESQEEQKQDAVSIATPSVASPRIADLAETPSMNTGNTVTEIAPNDAAHSLQESAESDNTMKRADSVHSTDAVEQSADAMVVEGQAGEESKVNGSTKAGLEDSDVEAAREKTNKKKKNKNKKKASAVPVVA